jgi:hypothetical protein
MEDLDAIYAPASRTADGEASTSSRKLLWLDCDPGGADKWHNIDVRCSDGDHADSVCDIGHDDAIAILMALYEPTIKLMGLSTAS